MLRFSDSVRIAAAAALLSIARPALAEDPPTLEELEEKVEVLTEEVRHAREQANLPETDEELKSRYGMGPAASKVYSKTSGLSIGGYAEFFVQAPTGTDGSQRSGDMLRMVPYLGYKFTDKILMNTEIEFEHGSTEENLRGEEGAVSIEFCYLDFLLSESVNVRAGNLLMPVGFLNEMHEPPFYWGNARPDIERLIIPSTWHELGVGIHGAIASTVSYNAYLVNGLNAQGFEETGIREGRQGGTEPLSEDAAGVFALRIEPGPALSVGGSLYAGQSGQNQLFAGEEIRGTTILSEGHLEVRTAGFKGRLLYVRTFIHDAQEISTELGHAVPESQWGNYVEAGYDLATLFDDPPLGSMFLWSRYEIYDLQNDVPPGFTKDDALDANSITIGFDVKPHPNVVLKLDAVIQDNEADAAVTNPVRLGAGFIF
jgi:hypothetical protein